MNIFIMYRTLVMAINLFFSIDRRSSRVQDLSEHYYRKKDNNKLESTEERIGSQFIVIACSKIITYAIHNEWVCADNLFRGGWRFHMGQGGKVDLEKVE